MRRTLLLLIGVTLASGTVYPVRMVFDSPTMEAMSEGVMWGTGQSPVGSKPSMIDVQLDAAALGGRTSRVGVLITSQVDLAEQLSVNPALRPLLLCQKDYATANFTAHFYDVPSKIHVTHEVERTGVELVMLYVCPGDDAGGSMSPVRFDGSIAFRNPYGYLAAATFGFLPYFAALAALYLVTGVAYCCVLALNRAFVSRLQWLVLAIFVLGFVETAAMFGLFAQINATGETACCPVHPLVVITVVLNALKRCGSRMLLLVVCFGFGVTKSTLPFTQGCSVFLLGAAYLAVAINHDVQFEMSGTPSAAAKLTNVPVMAVDFAFILWTLSSVDKIEAELTASNQHAKLAMYRRLTAVLIVCIASWSLFAVFELAAGHGFVAVAWKFDWLLHSFWHSAYFALLVAIAVIWRPSRLHQEQIWLQLAMHDDGYDEEEMAVIDGDLDIEFDNDDEYDVDDDEVESY